MVAGSSYLVIKDFLDNVDYPRDAEDDELIPKSDCGEIYPSLSDFILQVPKKHGSYDWDALIRANKGNRITIQNLHLQRLPAEVVIGNTEYATGTKDGTNMLNHKLNIMLRK